MKKVVLTFSIFTLLISVFLFTSCNSSKDAQTTTDTASTTQQVPGKYADSEYIGTWYNADAEEVLICTLKYDGTAIFKDDNNATWEETQAGITVTATVDGKETTMEGYFVIAGDGYVARATEANMHYLDEGGTMQLEIMLTENTCVDCVKK